MANNFDAFFARVLKDEGESFEDVSGDGGGPTKCGLTYIDIARWNNLPVPRRNGPGWDNVVRLVQQITPTTARPVYKKFYWDNVRADELPHGLDIAVVDYAVNSGTGKAISTLGGLVGCQDRTVTDAMLTAIERYPSLDDLITHFQEARRAYLIEISDPGNPKYLHNVKFRKGWLDREARVRHTALTMAAEMPPSVPASRTIARAMDIPAEPSPATTDQHPVMVAAQSKTVWSLLTAAMVYVGNGVQWAVDKLTDLLGSADDIRAEVSSMSDPVTSLLGALKINATEIGTAVVVVCMIVAVIRHVDVKRGKS